MEDQEQKGDSLRSETGMTLIELLMGVVISGIMLGALTGAILSYMRSASATSSLMVETGELQVAATNFTTDVQSAERVEKSVATCGTVAAGETAVVEFSWNDYSSTTISTPVKVSYIYTGAENGLRRTACRNGVVVGESTPIRHIEPAQAPQLLCDGSPVDPCPLTSRRVDLKFPVCTFNASNVCPNAPIPATLTGVRRLPS